MWWHPMLEILMPPVRVDEASLCQAMPGHTSRVPTPYRAYASSGCLMTPSCSPETMEPRDRVLVRDMYGRQRRGP